MTVLFRPEDVLDLWFPADGHWETIERHGAFRDERMQGGMDAVICQRFGPLTLAAATSLLDHWAVTPRGRLALVVALDQFPRSLWRGTPATFAQDIKATRVAWKGIAEGDVEVLAPWEAAFFVIASDHCEGPDHLERFDRTGAVVERIIARFPAPLAGMADGFRDQRARVREKIERFGRHAHRNPVLGRPSSPSEEAYIATGDFPHVRRVGTETGAGP